MMNKNILTGFALIFFTTVFGNTISFNKFNPDIEEELTISEALVDILEVVCYESIEISDGGYALNSTNDFNLIDSQIELLFSGSDFENWKAFSNFPGNYGDARNMLSQSPAGTGVDGGRALAITGTPSSSAPTLLRVRPPKNISFEGKTKVVFYMKGTAIKNSPLIQWYLPDGQTFYCFELRNTGSEDRVIEATVGKDENTHARRRWAGDIDTNGEWVKITLPIADLPYGIGNSTPGEGYLFAFRSPTDTELNLLIDNITLE